MPVACAAGACASRWPRSAQPARSSRSTICCSRAATSSIRRTGSARFATWPSRTARWRRSRPASIPPRRSRWSTSRDSTSRPGSSTSTSTSSPARASAARTPATTASIPTASRLRNGVTTVVDAGCAGWRNFEDFKQRIIDRSKTRVLAFLNIVGHGMRGGQVRAGPGRHGSEADGRHGAAPQGRDRRRQDRALLGPGVGAGRARGRSGNDREHSGDGGFRHQSRRSGR